MFRTVLSRAVLGLLLVGALLAPVRGSADPFVGQVDDFDTEDETQGWAGNTYQECVETCFPIIGCSCSCGPGNCSPPPPPEMGAKWEEPGESSSEGYLELNQVTSTPEIESWNSAADHKGNYAAAGIEQVEVDLTRPNGGAQGSIRVGIRRGTTCWVTSNSFAKSNVPAGPQWTHYQFFLLDAPYMTLVYPAVPPCGANNSLAYALQAVDEIRIINAPTAQWEGSIGSTLGVDNFEFPEPGAVSGLAAGAALLALLAARRRPNT